MPEFENGTEALRETTGFLTKLGERFVNYLPTLLVTLVVFLIGLLLARLINHLMTKAMRRSVIDRTAAGFGRSLVRILLYVMLVIICLTLLGVPTASMITVIGAAGVTVGLALQNSLSNLAGGFILLFAKPLQSGDYVIVGDKEGFVESVTILYTELKTWDNRRIYLPNSVVTAGAVVNLSKSGALRVYVLASVSYGTDLQHAREVILSHLSKQPMFLSDPAPTVSVKELADSGVVLNIGASVTKEHFFSARPKMLEYTKEALDQAGIEIPFPQVTVHHSET